MSLRIYSGDLLVGEANIKYYTDMEEIGNLLANAANPVEFMCQVMIIDKQLVLILTFLGVGGRCEVQLDLLNSWNKIAHLKKGNISNFFLALTVK